MTSIEPITEAVEPITIDKSKLDGGSFKQNPEIAD